KEKERWTIKGVEHRSLIDLKLEHDLAVLLPANCSFPTLQRLELIAAGRSIVSVDLNAWLSAAPNLVKLSCQCPMKPLLQSNATAVFPRLLYCTIDSCRTLIANSATVEALAVAFPNLQTLNMRHENYDWPASMQPLLK